MSRVMAYLRASQCCGRTTMREQATPFSRGQALCRPGVPGQEAQDPAGNIPGANGLADSLAKAGGAHPAHYPKEIRGRRPYSLSVMLRVTSSTLLQLSDPGMEDLLYEVESVRRFAGLRLSEPIPDESTILHFRHLLEEHHLGQRLLGNQRPSGRAGGEAAGGDNSGCHHH